MTIEEIIRKDGFYITAAQGISMLPCIRPKVDTVVVERLTGECGPMDIVLYYSHGGQLVLHRVIRNGDGEYLISGDNCISLEHIEKKKVIGKLTAIYRDEKKIDLDTLRYRLYVFFWCRPYSLRILLLRSKQKIRRICGREATG